MGTTTRYEAPSGAVSLELVVFAGNATTVHRLPAMGAVRIGRGPGNDISIDHGSVSRRHAVLRVGRELFVEDLGSANGVHVRDTDASRGAGETESLKRLPQRPVAMEVGEYLSLGAVLAVVRFSLSAEAIRLVSTSPVVCDPKTVAVFDLAALIAPSNMSVLVTGETGVGKELVARAVHEQSRRASGPFVAVNCGALAPTLIESELFGHGRGAFTGAATSRVGLLESADGGTLFLDVVGELPGEVQVKLLRVLEDGNLRPVGSRQQKQVDVRYVTATNRDLQKDMACGTFRQDLYFRLSGMTLDVPPLRCRPGDIEPMTRAFVARAAEQLGRKAPEIPPETLSALHGYSWPGNVRELRNAVERAVVLSTGGVLLRNHLRLQVAPLDAPPSAGLAPTTTTVPLSAPLEDLRRQMNELERKRLLDAIERCSGNQTRAAELLGISRRTLVNRLNAFGAPRPRKRTE